MKQPDQEQYYLSDNGDFIIIDYNSVKPFSSFFPGIAGINGIPMWVFYVNRGQALCGMGTQDKDHPIMEFMPANMAYNQVTRQGFRTFLKFTCNSNFDFYEPFQNNYRDRALNRTQKMIIAPSTLTLEEENHTLGLRFKVEYSPVPEDDYAGLIRTLTIENIGKDTMSMDGLDGFPVIVPYGVDNFCLKNMRRTIEAFVEVKNLENKAPFFKGKVEPADRPDVVKITRGNFYLGFEIKNKTSELVTPIVDPSKIFGHQHDFGYPERFLNQSIEEMSTGQITNNQLPSAMGSFRTELNPGAKYSFTSIIGHVYSVIKLNEMIPRITTTDYIKDKSETNRDLIDQLTQNNLLLSGHSALNHYTRQNFLDNAQRGGFPVSFEGNNKCTTLYLYSRKHGDMERDYNEFRLMPTKFSQGNGNFRDINQNRRSDLFFNPAIGSDNIEYFYNLIQPDGFNPLVLKETSFKVTDKDKLINELIAVIDSKQLDLVTKFLERPFTAGELMTYLDEHQIKLKESSEKILGLIAGHSEKITASEYGESFWIDHWTYNLDLLENYLAIYPDRFVDLMFNSKTFTFYDTAETVQPRHEKYVLWNNKPMQLGAVSFDQEHEELIRSRKDNQNQLRTSYGQGEVYKTTLIVKLVCIIVNKLASLDPEGIGVEMEAGKPGWYDALNGLPGQFGSSVCETLEVKRHILFLLNKFDEYKVENCQITLFKELDTFLIKLNELLEKDLPPFEFWDKANELKEEYRSQTQKGISGEETDFSLERIKTFCKSALIKLEQGINKALDDDGGIIRTYYRYEVTNYKTLERSTKSGYTGIKPLKFKLIQMPLFLEGPVHYLRSLNDKNLANSFSNKIKDSELYDPILKMYKVNASLEEEPMEIGRARVFSPGWLENESIWLHMEYKYILELLRNGLSEKFYGEFINVCVPFLDPKSYGRSILENSSFLASSTYQDKTLHGNGFVARLSGATAEFIHMLILMTTGPRPFRFDNKGELNLRFEPVLPDWLFTSKKQTITLLGQQGKIELPEQTLSFMFLGKTLVVYHNPKMKNSFGENGVKPVSLKLIDWTGQINTIESEFLGDELARSVRDGKISKIEITLG